MARRYQVYADGKDLGTVRADGFFEAFLKSVHRDLNAKEFTVKLKKRSMNFKPREIMKRKEARNAQTLGDLVNPVAGDN